VRICFYTTGHGFGHAARDLAVVERLLDDHRVQVEVRTSAPRWFFEDLLSERFAHAEVDLDPGVVQSDSFNHDPQATATAWEAVMAGAEATVEREAAHLRASTCSVVVVDVAPLACAAAARAGLPCLLLGNWLWDWILEPYRAEEPRFGPIIDWIGATYRRARVAGYLRLPLSPDDSPQGLGVPEQRLGFIARRAHRPPDEVRAQLGLGAEETMVLISFGGFGVDQLELESVKQVPGLRCVWDRGPGRAPHLISAQSSGVSYPELIRAADVILTKPGFSIISEAVTHGTLLAYAPRRGFRESALLERFLRQRWPSVQIEPTALADGSWVGPTVELVRAHADVPRPRLEVDGAARAAQRIVELGSS
jgi:hypothetical protein